MHGQCALVVTAALLAVHCASACQAFAPSDEGRLPFDSFGGDFGVIPSPGPPQFGVAPTPDFPPKDDGIIRLPVEPLDAAADAASGDAAAEDAGFGVAHPDAALLDATPDSD